MKKILIPISILAIVAIALASYGTARADGSVGWQGHGSDNLPCAGGAHWVLTGANDATSATLTVNGDSYGMHQSGQGSWSADSSGALASGLSASASWTGNASNPSLQLSHCTEGNETPTEPPTETSTPPTETSTPPTETSTPPTETSTPPTETPPAVTPTPHNQGPICKDFINSDGSLKQQKAEDWHNLVQKWLNSHKLWQDDQGKWHCNPLETGASTMSISDMINGWIAWIVGLISH